MKLRCIAGSLLANEIYLSYNGLKECPMDRVVECERELDVLKQVDVLIVGAGPAGVSAAITAGRLGLKTLLVEQSSSVGGVATTGLMSHWTGDSLGPLYEEILKRAKVKGVKYPLSQRIKLFKSMIDTEKLKTTLFDMLEEAAVETLLYTFASNVIMDGSRVNGIIVENRSGRFAIRSSVVVDASGDGHIAARAGVPFEVGRSDGKVQPLTLMFKIGGVDFKKAILPSGFEDNIAVKKRGQGIQDLGKAHLSNKHLGHVLLYPSTLPGCVTVNMTNVIGVDPLDTFALSKAEIECRKQMVEIVDFLKKYVPGYKNCYPITAASQIGVRESRRMEGVYTLHEDDIKGARKFDDWIATNCYFNFDVHGIDKPGLDKTGSQKEFDATSTARYTIPAGALIPKEINGLLFAGRNISGTHIALSNYRAMPICVNMGQGAAALCKIALESDCELRHVDIQKVQSLLLSLGVTL